jgi:hypothetical protein
MLQLEQVLGIACHVHPATMVVVLKLVARIILACLPLWSEWSWIRYREIGVPAVAGRFYEHRAVSGT